MKKLKKKREKDLKYLFTVPNYYNYSDFIITSIDIYFEAKVDSFKNGIANDDAQELVILKKDEIDISKIGFEGIKKEEKGGIAKGILAGIGAALGIAAIGIGGKMIYDKYNKKPSEEINEDTDIVIQKLKKQKSIKPTIIKNELDANYIRANSIKEDENDIIQIKNSFICPISKIMMDNPVNII